MTNLLVAGSSVKISSVLCVVLTARHQEVQFKISVITSFEASRSIDHYDLSFTFCILYCYWLGFCCGDL